jgi:hypothetical protein
LYCIVLYCIVLYCIVLYCIVLYCIVLYCIVLCTHIVGCVLRGLCVFGKCPCRPPARPPMCGTAQAPGDGGSGSQARLQQSAEALRVRVAGRNDEHQLAKASNATLQTTGPRACSEPPLYLSGPSICSRPQTPLRATGRLTQLTRGRPSPAGLAAGPPGRSPPSSRRRSLTLR